MNAATTTNPEQARMDEAAQIIELRKRLLAFCEEGARVFTVNRTGATTSCVSGYVVSVSSDHVTFDVVGRNVTLQLARVIACREHRRKPDVSLVVRERNE